MLHHTHQRRLIATAATAVVLAATAPAALAMPIDGTDSVGAVPERAQIRVVRVQVDQGLDWSDAGIGAAGMLAVVLIGYGGAQALTSAARRDGSVVHS